MQGYHCPRAAACPLLFDVAAPISRAFINALVLGRGMPRDSESLSLATRFLSSLEAH